MSRFNFASFVARSTFFQQTLNAQFGLRLKITALGCQPWLSCRDTVDWWQEIWVLVGVACLPTRWHWSTEKSISSLSNKSRRIAKNLLNFQWQILSFVVTDLTSIFGALRSHVLHTGSGEVGSQKQRFSPILRQFHHWIFDLVWFEQQQKQHKVCGSGDRRWQGHEKWARFHGIY